MKRSKKELVKRYILMVVGLYIMTFAVMITVSTNLGTSPLSTLPNVFSYEFSSISFGTLTFIWNMILILSQILVLRKKFDPIQFLQIPLTFVFSAFLDVNEKIVSYFLPTTLTAKIIYLIIGLILLAFSITLTIEADVVINSGEAIVKAISDVTGWTFGYLKVALDVFYVVAGFVFSLVFFGELKGVGVGTVVIAVFTGFIVNFFGIMLHKPLKKMLTK